MIKTVSMRSRLFFLIAIVVLSSMGVIIVGLFRQKPDIAIHMRRCFDNNGENRCYMNVANMFFTAYPLHEILDTFKREEGKEEVFSRCHEVTHFLGRLEYEKTNDTKKALSTCTGVCHGGCYHGVMEGYLKDKLSDVSLPTDEQLGREVAGMCGDASDYDSTRLYGECLHGVGHALMFVTEADLPRSLRLCDGLTPGTAPEVCYGGVFMENSSSSTNADHPSKFLKADDPLYPCTALDDRYKKICYAYQSSYFVELTRQNWSEVIRLCETVPPPYQDGCFRFVGSNQVGRTQELAVMRDTCLIVQEPSLRRSCLQGVVAGLGGRYIGNMKKMSSFCQLVSREATRPCFTAIGEVVRTWTNDSASESLYCQQLEDKDFVSWCREGVTKI